MKRLQTRLPGSIQKIRLDHYLADWLPHALGRPVSKSKIRELIYAGGVYVNRHRNKNGSTPLYSGAIIEVYYDEERLDAKQSARLAVVRLETSRVVYEDEWLIVIDKPSGIPTQPTLDPGRANLFDLLKNFLASREKIPEPYVGLHHRLDRDTSGLVLFTKREEANKGVADLFFTHQIQKTYQCLCWRSPIAPKLEVNELFKIENFLGKVSAKGENSRFGEVNSGGDFASTDFRVIETFRDAYWVEAQPRTGRTHQIRVHTSEMGIPILGDPAYFPKDVLSFVQAPRLMLHASKLTFQHPITGEAIEVISPLPNEYIQVLGGLK